MIRLTGVVGYNLGARQSVEGIRYPSETLTVSASDRDSVIEVDPEVLRRPRRATGQQELRRSRGTGEESSLFRTGRWMGRLKIGELVALEVCRALVDHDYFAGGSVFETIDPHVVCYRAVRSYLLQCGSRQRR